MKNILLILLLLPLSLGANILQVALDGSQAFSSIQAAINAATEQDTILVHPGTYYENVLIENKNLTLGSLELCTSDSSYISQTIINGNQNGSCIKIDYSEADIQGLSLTNGSGSLHTAPDYTVGGGIFAHMSNVAITNCQIFGNRSNGGSGVSIDHCSTYMAGTVIFDNWSDLGAGGVIFSSVVDGFEDVYYDLQFDPDNRCSIYNNIGNICNDIFIATYRLNHIDVYLDKFTIPQTDDYFKECVLIENRYYNQGMNYNFYYNETVLHQHWADLYVSPDGDDNNSGLSCDQPLKTIAIALHRIGANAQNPGTIHLANGRYAEDQHFPLNARSYVSIVGESEAGVLFEVGAPTIFIMGKNAEKEFVLKNITFQGQVTPMFGRNYLIHFNNACDNFQNHALLDKPSITLENISFRDIVTLYHSDDNLLSLISIYYPEQLILRNITIDNCMFSYGLNLWGGNVFGDNIRIRNTKPGPYSRLAGTVLKTWTQDPARAGGDYIFQNMEITNCKVIRQNPMMTDFGPVSLADHPWPATTKTYFINCTFADNIWSGPGRGSTVIMGRDSKTVTFINSIISHRSGANITLATSSYPTDNPTEAKLRLLNCMLGPGEKPEDAIYYTSEWVNTEVEWYGANISLNPEFHAWDEDNAYALGMNSPCIDAGTTDFGGFGLPDWYQLAAYDLAGDPRIYGGQIDMGAYEWQGQVGVDDPSIPAIHSVSLDAFPNPFKVFTNIKVNLDKAESASVTIYNIKGQKVKTIALDPSNAGEQFTYWDGRDADDRLCSSGIYLLNLTVNGRNVSSKKVTLVR
ncbi:MAG TPA: T9SS type A sorting domain-containing protein [Candidatus Cloacimonetes bacterium]|nr:T9SS type A sorting domain-containing protein [Candidatus Cloacimonadota bacterium]